MKQTTDVDVELVYILETLFADEMNIMRAVSERGRDHINI
jgi:hypothetical protein